MSSVISPSVPVADIEAAAIRYPGVAVARVQPTADDTYSVAVVPWTRRDDETADSPLAGLAQINPHESRFLHDEIFIEQSYLQGGITLREDAVIFDVGANIGMFALFVHSRCPSARVFAFEPVTEVFQALRANLDRYGVPAIPLQYGLSEHDGQIEFNFYPGISIMSCRSDYADFDNEVHLIQTYVENAERSGPAGREAHLAAVSELVSRDFEYSTETCQLRTLSAAVVEHRLDRIDLLKLDVQRAELDVLLGIADEHWDLIQQISMEIHDEAGTPTEGRGRLIADLLQGKGFELVVAEEQLLAGTGRLSLQAVRPGYRDDPRPVRAEAGPLPQLNAGSIAEFIATEVSGARVEVSIIS